MDETTTTCHVCGKREPPNTDEGDVGWVSCDKCLHWFHFECVNVDSDVAGKNWTCDDCMEAETRQKINAIMHAQKSRAASTPVPSVTAKSTGPSKNSTNGVTTLLGAANASGASASEEVVGYDRSLPEENNKCDNTHLLLSMLEEETKIKEDYIRKKYAILSQKSGDCSKILSANTNELTSTQIAARQAIPTDLPIFGGEPGDWPAFISSYENSTKVAGFSDTENMLRLQKCLKGKAKELVKDKLLIPNLVRDVIATLRLFFGRPEHIIERMIERVRKIPQFKDKLEGLIEFALGVRNICATVEACNLQAHLNNPMLIKELVDKLPNHQKLSWAMHIRTSSTYTLRNFSEWIYGYAEVAATVVSPASIKMHAVNTHTTDADVVADKQKCAACEENGHKLVECEKFKSLSPEDRLKIVESNHICQRCLKLHRKSCFRRTDCGINGCKSKHNPLLHVCETKADTSQNKHGIVSAHQLQNEPNKQYFRIVPVKLYGKHNINTFAFLDEGSSVTLIDRKVFNRLGIDGISKPLCLQWTGDTTRMEDESICASIQISNENASTHKYWLNNVQTVSNLALPRQSLDAEYLQAKYSHLTDVPIKTYENAEPGILIGNDNWKVAVPSKELRQLVFGTSAIPMRAEWTQTPFIFGSPKEELSYGLRSPKNATRGLLSVVQGFILKHLLFMPRSSLHAASHDPLYPTAEKQKDALINAMLEILRMISDKGPVTIVIPSAEEEIFVTHSVTYFHDSVTEKLYIFHLNPNYELEFFLKRHYKSFTEEDGPGTLLFLYSAVLTRSTGKVRTDLDSTKIVPLTMSNNEEGSLMIVTLLLTGRATPYIHNGVINVGDENSYALQQYGILKRCTIGLLLWNNDCSQSVAARQPGSRLKTPNYPIWITICAGHYGVIFNRNAELLSNYHAESRFDVTYYSCSGHQIAMTIDNRSFNEQASGMLERQSSSAESTALSGRANKDDTQTGSGNGIKGGSGGNIGQENASKEESASNTPLQRLIHTKWEEAHIRYQGQSSMLSYLFTMPQ